MRIMRVKRNIVLNGGQTIIKRGQEFTDLELGQVVRKKLVGFRFAELDTVQIPNPKKPKVKPVKNKATKPKSAPQNKAVRPDENKAG